MIILSVVNKHYVKICFLSAWVAVSVLVLLEALLFSLSWKAETIYGLSICSKTFACLWLRTLYTSPHPSREVHHLHLVSFCPGLSATSAFSSRVYPSFIDSLIVYLCSIGYGRWKRNRQDCGFPSPPFSFYLFIMGSVFGDFLLRVSWLFMGVTHGAVSSACTAGLWQGACALRSPSGISCIHITKIHVEWFTVLCFLHIDSISYVLFCVFLSFSWKSFPINTWKSFDGFFLGGLPT